MAALAALAGGCGSGATSGPDAATACADYATEVCTAAQKCEPGVLQYFYPAGLPSCISTSKLGCAASIGAPHSGATPALFQQCGRALAAMTCTEYLSASNDPSCLPHGGAIPQGGSCGDSWQCATGRCAVTGAGCGSCVAQVGLGAPCRAIECADGLVCAASTRGSTSSVCSKPVSLGEPCFDSNRLSRQRRLRHRQRHLRSVAGRRPGLRHDEHVCDVSQGLSLCDPYLALCEAPADPVAPGQRCGWLSVTSPYVACNGLCVLTPGSNAGTCFSALAEGQACTSADLCGYNLRCLGGPLRSHRTDDL